MLGHGSKFRQPVSVAGGERSGEGGQRRCGPSVSPPGGAVEGSMDREECGEGLEVQLSSSTAEVA